MISGATVGLQARVEGVALTRASAPLALQQISPYAMARLMLPVEVLVHSNPSLPIANTQSGSLYEDRDNASVRWYLPAYSLAGDPDSYFSFSASQAGVDSLGNPANRGSLTLSLKKAMPQDAALFQQANPSFRLQEIPLHIASVTLTTTFKDAATGEPGQASYSAAMATAADGSLVLTFENILGVSVVILYENLVTDGGSQLLLSASADMLVRIPGSVPQYPPPRPVLERVPPFRVSPILMARSETMQASRVAAPARPLPAQIAWRIPYDPVPVPGPVSAPQQYAPTTLSKAIAIPIGTHFAANAYQLKFSLSTAAGTRPILSVQDLQSFNVRQTEFTELKALGDISQRYPSLSRLYMGVLSKTIVVIPRRYAVVRDTAGCMAVCEALLDSAPSAASRCKFEFTFVLAPEISPVDFVKLSQEVAGRSEFQEYSVTLPEQLSDTPAATLATVFQSSFQYSAGLQPHTFTLAIDIRDQDLDSPAVGNANLFLKMLAAAKQPYLTGALSLKLDDGYPSPVQSGVVLNFAETSASDELAFSVDEGAGTIRLTNHSPLDLAVSRCAIVGGQAILDVPLNQTIPGGGTAAIPLPANHTGIGVVADGQLALPSPLTKDALTRYLTFQVQDVQNTQFALSVNASGVDFAGRGIDRMDIQVTFPALPQVTPAPLALNRLHTADGTQVLIPIQNAITQLAGTASFTVHFTDTQKAGVKFTMNNDFCDESVLVVSDVDIPTA